MQRVNRRDLAAGLASTIAFSAVPRRAQSQTPKRFRMLLNTSYSGPQAWMLLAIDKGYLRREGIELELMPGGGAYTAAPRMASSDFDIGYGDVNALIEVAAREPAKAPVAVFMAFNASPSTVAVDVAGPVRSPKDLEGRTVIGHASDVALRTFGAFCRSAGVDATRVKVIPEGGGMLGMVESMRESKDVHGVFGYVSTLDAAMAAGDRDPAKTVRHLKFAEHAPDLYGSALMVSRRLMREEPAVVAGIVRAFNAGLADVARDPDAGIEAVMRRVPGGRRDVERLRLDRTLQIEMAHKEGARLGLGDVDDARFARSIAMIADTNRLPRVPAAGEVLVKDFLPPLADRVKTLAR